MHACAVPESRMKKNKKYNLAQGLPKEDVHSTEGSSYQQLSWWKLCMAAVEEVKANQLQLAETLAAVEEDKADQLQLVETLAAVEEVKADQLQLVETLAAVEEVKADQRTAP